MKRKNLFNILLFVLITMLVGMGIEKKQKFVKVEGSKFIYNNKPYCFVGINFWHAAYLGAELYSGDRERLKRELNLMVKYGINNVRICASSEQSFGLMSVSPVFMPEMGKYNEQLLEGLDFVLNEMGKRKMKAVLMLNNYWQWSGGMGKYVNWMTGETVRDPDKYQNWIEYMTFVSRFYTDTIANKAYTDYIKMLVERKNTCSGKVYKNDPTIMTWELANEPRPSPLAYYDTTNTYPSIFYNWVKETADFIKNIDNNHLVSIGSEGINGTLDRRELCVSIHSLSSIDYLTFHTWPKNWGWYNAKQPEETFKTSLKSTVEYIKKHIELANEINKPCIFEEFGMERDLGLISPQSSTNYRNMFLDTIMNLMIENIQQDGPFRGLNYWAWGGEAIADTTVTTFWAPGEPYMGDPPQEPQGLNTIFNTDTSTLNIFLNNKNKLFELCK